MKIDRKKLNREALKLGIKMIILFGSQTKSQTGRESDYDVAVLTVPEKNISDLENYSEILFSLSNSLDIPDYKIDLTNLNEANFLLLYEIMSKGELIYGEKDLFDERRALAFREYIDAKPLFDLEDYLIKKRQLLIKTAIKSHG